MKGATNFGALNSKQKVVWSRRVWSAARDQMFIKRFLGTSENSMIQRITELTKSEKGERVLMQLVADLVEDGVIDDNDREGREEQMQNFEQEITIGLISHQVRNAGKLSDQKSVINTRAQAKNKLAYWLANRVDQLALLTLAGVSYAYLTNGAPRPSSSPFPNLAFAADVRPPSAKRHLRWDATNGLVAGDTTQVAADDIITYKTIVDLVAYAKDHYIKPLMAGGKEYYVMLVKPGTMAQLKKDADYQRAITTAMPRSKENPWFTGAGAVTVDGVVFHEHRMVYSTKGAASGSKWGAGGAIDGTRSMLCGAQALGMADLGGSWAEKRFQYDSRWGISVDKMFGLLLPEFFSIYDNSVEDFGRICLDHYLQ
ncbi:MAG: N4-gp56 family major capsid protein [Elusimicrobiales bacterium]